MCIPFNLIDAVGVDAGAQDIEMPRLEGGEGGLVAAARASASTTDSLASAPGTSCATHMPDDVGEKPSTVGLVEGVDVDKAAHVSEHLCYLCPSLHRVVPGSVHSPLDDAAGADDGFFCEFVKKSKNQVERICIILFLGLPRSYIF